MLEVALDLDGAGFEPMQETLQGGGVVALERQRQVHELGDGVLGLKAKPRHEPPAPAEGAEDVGE